jgi:hypothetical protein
MDTLSGLVIFGPLMIATFAMSIMFAIWGNK